MSESIAPRATRLMVVTTHPIQYQSPWFRHIASAGDVELIVIYFREPSAQEQGEGFGVNFTWNVPLRDGFRSKVLGVAKGWWNALRGVTALSKALQSERPDVVLVTGWNEPLLILAQLLATVKRYPVLVRGDSNDLRARPKTLVQAHRFLFRLGTGYLVVGQSNRRLYQGAGVANARIFPGAHFVDNRFIDEQFRQNIARRGELRSAAGLSEADFVVLFCGKHVAFKRPMLLLEAAAALRQRGIAAKVVYAGSGELSDELRKHAANLEVPTHFTGFLNQSELWRAYLLADAFVLPSNTGETWGLVTNEAMLFGLPVVVSTDVGCAEDLVVPGQTGYTFSGGAEELANELEKLAVDRTEARRMGERGRAHVQQNYSMEVATEGLMTAIRAIAR